MILKNFIVFEGIDGSGTSTQIKKIVESNPNKFYATAEPTQNETGKFLRRNADRIEFSSDFTIYDTDDQKRLMKQILKDNNIDEKIMPPKSA